MEIEEFEYKYPIGLTSQFYFCGMPFRLDAYRGCPAKCVYCFVDSRNGNYLRNVQYADPGPIRKLFYSVLDKSIQPRNVLMECLRRKMPLHFGGMSDPFLIPKDYQHITLEILRTLDEYQYPTLISTKANVIRNSEFAEIILGKPHFALQISFSTFDDSIAKIAEPNAPSPTDRLAGAKLLADSGNWVACRLQPYFPGQNVDNLVSFISMSGFRHITVEHFKLPFDNAINIEALNSCFNINLLKLFEKNGRVRRGREFELPDEIRLEGIEEFIDTGKKYNISVGIGDNGFQHMSSSWCCCGIDTLPGFEKWFKHNLTVAIKRVGRDNVIRYEAISDEWAPELSISRMINSKTRLRKAPNSVRNQIKTQWDRKGQNSPIMFYNTLSEKSGAHYRYLLVR